MSIPRAQSSVHSARRDSRAGGLVPRALAGALAVLAALPAAAGPTIACPDGPDPLRFRPEVALGATSTDREPVAIDAGVDPGTGREWIAAAWLSPAGAVTVAVSGDGGCTFQTSTGGLDATVVSPPGPPISERPAVAIRAGSQPRVAVAWNDGGNVVVRTTGTLDGTFGAPATLDGGARGGPRLAYAPAPATESLAAAWLADAGGSRVVRASITLLPLDSAAWPAPSTWNGSLGADLGAQAQLALASDAAGTAGGPGFTLLGTVTPAGSAHVARCDDPAAGFGAWRRVDDGSLLACGGVALGSASSPPLTTTSWTALSWSGTRRTGPATDRVAADSGLVDASSVASDFEGAIGSPNPIQAAPVGAGSRTAVAACGSAPGVTTLVAFEEGNEIRAVRRPLGSARPHLAGGCNPFQLTGLSPARSGGRASAPAADALGDDAVLLFVDDRAGPQAWFKRADSSAPLVTGVAATAAPCGPPPRIQVDWATPPCDVVRLDVEVGTVPGGTDFVRDGLGGNGLLVEGLRPITAYFVRIHAWDSAGNEAVSTEVSATTATCSPALLTVTVARATDACASGSPASGDGRADPGESVRLDVTVANSGSADATAVTLRAQSRSPYVTSRSGTLSVGDVAAGGSVAASLDFDVSATAPCGARLEALLRTDVSGVAWGDLVALSGGPPCTTCRNAACTTTADASRSMPTVLCAGDTIVLDAGGSASSACNGIPVYEWWEGANMVSNAMITSRQPSGSTTYRLVTRCSTDLDCSSESSVAVTVHPLPPLVFTEIPPPPHCVGDLVTIQASTTDPLATFAWGDGATGPSHDVSTPGNLSCTVRDTNNCARSRTIRVDFGRIPPADAGPDVIACGAALIGTGGFPALDYRWDPPDGLSSRWVAQPRATPASPTDYTLTVTDPTTGCQASDVVHVETTPGPGPAQDLKLARDGSNVIFTWTEPADSLITRVYSDVTARDAAHARAGSPTASLECEAAGTCAAALHAPSLVFYQAVSACLDGENEGPN